MRKTLVISFVAGAAVMAAEIAASRLIAPYFGSSTPVWGALIAFVLSSMAAGAYLGGKAADRDASLPRIGRALALAAALLGALPFVGRALLAPAVDSLFAGHPLWALSRVLAFAAVAAVPLLLLGAVGPFLIRATAAGDASAGTRAGALSATGTLGSIAGTLLSAVVVLPAIGTARCMGLFALVLAFAAGLALSWRWRVAALAAPAASLVLGALALPRHAQAIDAVESPYALIQTLEFPDGHLELILDQAYAVQSTFRPGARVMGEVFGHYLLAPAMAERAPSERPPRVLFLGLGGGTGARGILESYPGAKVVGVELDPEVVRMAREHFALPPETEVHVEDARTFLSRGEGPFDAIVVDAFRFPYVPFHLVTREFDALLQRNLAPGGVVCVNVGRYGDEKAVVDAVAGTLATVFPEVAAADARNHSNTLLYTGPPGLAERLHARARSLPRHLQGLGGRVAAELRTRAPGEPLTDDLAPVEQMTDAILLRALWRTGGVL